MVPWCPLRLITLEFGGLRTLRWLETRHISLLCPLGSTGSSGETGHGRRPSSREVGWPTQWENPQSNDFVPFYGFVPAGQTFVCTCAPQSFRPNRLNSRCLLYTLSKVVLPRLAKDVKELQQKLAGQASTEPGATVGTARWRSWH